MKTTIAILFLLVAGAANADPVDTDIPLPELTGAYDPGLVPPDDAPSVRTTTFTIPPEIEFITLMRFAVSGTSQEGQYITEWEAPGGGVVSDTLSVPASFRLFLTTPTLGDCYFFAGFTVPEPEFTDQSMLIVDCDFGPPPDLDVLLGQTVEAELVCYFEWEVPFVDPLATLTDARLVIEQFVPAERKTWGEIKALFR